MQHGKNYEKIAKVMGNFDFVKTQKLMEELDWSWFPIGEVPDVYRLVDMAHELLMKSLNVGSASSGGFEAVYKNGDLTLKFVAEEFTHMDDETLPFKE